MARKAFIMACNGPESMGRLKYAETDAKEFGKSLKNLRYGFDIVSPAKGNTPHQILEELQATASLCEPEDDFICYFSGHGDLTKGKLKLVLSDEVKPAEILSVSIQIIQSYIQDCRSRNKLLILDCCHSGGAVGMNKSGGADKLMEDITPLDDNDNHIVLVASERLSKIREYNDLKGSFLTKKICEGLNVNFDKVDQDKDQRISINDLMEYLKNARSDYNQYKTDDTKVPLPYIFGQQKGSTFYFTQEKYRWTPVELPCKDGSTMVVLPIPPHEGKCVCISKYPVTNGQYKNFVADKKWSEPEGRYWVVDDLNNTLGWQENFKPWENDKFNQDHQPVVCVSFKDASQYAAWIEAASPSWLTSLPPSSLKSVLVPPIYLWSMAAYGEIFARENYGDSQEWLKQTKEVNHKLNAPVDVYDDGSTTNIRGITGMFGNVWEWCAAQINVSFSINKRYRGNPILRGGGFFDDLSSINFKPFLESYHLVEGTAVSPSDFKSFDLGFRLAATLDVTQLSEEVQLKLSLCPAIYEGFWYDVENYKFSGEGKLK